MSFLHQALAIAGKDLRSEVRSKESVNASLSFALVILLLFMALMPIKMVLRWTFNLKYFIYLPEFNSNL